ncbi:MAG TPA: hypothetical protein PK953_04595 [Smithellaceae bacterium]|nr:hypothetical protein [Smithellaceae bacterium]
MKDVDKIWSAFSGLRSALLDKKALAQIGAFIKFRIAKRTAAGVDVDGYRFVPYTKRYAMFRYAHGRPINKVNLFFTGGMMAALDYTVDPDGRSAAVFFRPSPSFPLPGRSKGRAITNAEKASFLQEKREFFGMSAEDREKAVAIYSAAIQKAIDKLGK